MTHHSTALLAAALAASALYIAGASAGNAEAKTHHGAEAPGNPYGGRPSDPFAIVYPATSGSFTTIRISRWSRAAGATRNPDGDTASGPSAGIRPAASGSFPTIQIPGRPHGTGAGSGGEPSGGPSINGGAGGGARTRR
jgi:hypothetical protein